MKFPDISGCIRLNFPYFSKFKVFFSKAQFEGFFLAELKSHFQCFTKRVSAITLTPSSFQKRWLLRLGPVLSAAAKNEKSILNLKFFLFKKRIRGEVESKSWQIWANILFEWPPWPPRDLASNNDIHVYLVAEFDDMPSGISKEWKTKLWHFQNCMVWNLK